MRADHYSQVSPTKYAGKHSLEAAQFIVAQREAAEGRIVQISCRHSELQWDRGARLPPLPDHIISCHSDNPYFSCSGVGGPRSTCLRLFVNGSVYDIHTLVNL
jgi:hypothetical protein